MAWQAVRPGIRLHSNQQQQRPATIILLGGGIRLSSNEIAVAGRCWDLAGPSNEMLLLLGVACPTEQQQLIVAGRCWEVLPATKSVGYVPPSNADAATKYCC